MSTTIVRPSRGRVVHILTRLSRGGTEENTIATCAGQLKLGYEVFLIHGAECQEAIRNTIPSDVEVIQVESLVHHIDPVSDVRAVVAVRRLLKRIRPSIVHTHQSKGGIIGRLAVPGLRKMTVVHTVHIAPFVNVGGAQKLFYLLLEHVAALFTDRFISVSDGMMNAYRRYRIGQARNHHVVHSGMDLDKYLNANQPSDWRARIDWTEEARPFIALMLAAFDRRKRHAEFVAAADAFLKDAPDALICFAGEGHCEQQVREAVAQSEFPTRFRFLGHDPCPEKLIALANVCTLCSEREGLPRVLVQYVAACKRIVLMRLPGIDELINGYQGVTVVDDGDFRELMRELAEIYEKEFLPGRESPDIPPVDVSRWETDAMVAGIERVYQTAERVPA